MRVWALARLSLSGSALLDSIWPRVGACGRRIRCCAGLTGAEGVVLRRRERCERAERDEGPCRGSSLALSRSLSSARRHHPGPQEHSERPDHLELSQVALCCRLLGERDEPSVQGDRGNAPLAVGFGSLGCVLLSLFSELVCKRGRDHWAASACVRVCAVRDRAKGAVEERARAVGGRRSAGVPPTTAACDQAQRPQHGSLTCNQPQTRTFSDHCRDSIDQDRTRRDQKQQHKTGRRERGPPNTKMLRHPQLQLLRALAHARGAAGGTCTLPTGLASGVQRTWPLVPPSEGNSSGHQQQQGPPCSSPSSSSARAAFATRAPSFLDPQGRRAMKQKRQAQQRQRLLREL